ncbi:F-box protein SKIP23-like [Mangifera indica]|uniref:F-box protein SKIP23-like n=1 Tax=Mangifera indica TaxID=29780 RepID=UPI001CFBB617|nr:F-box protein SKIP23-like [Mangifera indica]
MEADDNHCSSNSNTTKMETSMAVIAQDKPSTRDWTRIPFSLLQDISKRLPNTHETLVFGTICKPFLRSISKPAKTLHRYTSLVIPAPVDYDPSKYCGQKLPYFSIIPSTVYALQPRGKNLEYTKPWLVRVIESFENGKVVLKDTSCMFQYTELPTKDFPRRLNLLDYQLRVVSKAYELDLTISDREDRRIKDKFASVKRFFVRKLIVTPTLEDVDEKAFVKGDYKFAAMALEGAGSLHVWRLGDDRWTVITCEGISSFEDIFYYKEKFFVLSHMGLAFTVDPQTLCVTRLAGPKPNMAAGVKFFLVFCEDLFMIIKYWTHNYPKPEKNSGAIHYPIYMEAFKLDEANNQWVELEKEFEDRVVFVGDGGSFTLLADEVPGFEGNCVVLGDVTFSGNSMDHPGYNAGVYNLKNHTCMAIRDHPNCSDLFWPPPKWVTKESNSSDS